MLKEYDVVELLAKIERVPIEPGTIGTILIAYTDHSEAFEVEFVDLHQTSMGSYTIPRNYLALVCRPSQD
jgi:Domain of unknown function (DUF4926)